MKRSGLKSVRRTSTPSRSVRSRAAPSATTGSSSKPFVGPTTTGLRISTSMPSRLSWKSMPSCQGSKTGFSSTSPCESLSMNRSGGRRPPLPSRVGATVPVPAGVTTALESSVVVRLSGSLPGRNSSTRPSTTTGVPIAGRPPRKTKMPSDVRRSWSGRASCIQKPLLPTAVTTPGTAATVLPSYGERCRLPWMSWIRRPSRPATKKLAVASAAIASGGSSASTSLTDAPRTVSVQRSPRGRLSAGSTA